VVVTGPRGGGSDGRSREDRREDRRDDRNRDRKRGSEQGSLRGSDRGDQVDHGASGGASLRGAPVVHGTKQGRQDSAAGSRSQNGAPARAGVETISEAERRRRSEYNRTLDESRKQILKDMDESQKNMSQRQSGDGGARAVQISGTAVNLDDLDMKKLTHEQNKDAREIARLEQEVANLTRSRRTGDLTMGDGSDVDKYVSMGRQGSVLSKSQREIGDLEYELERYQKEIELLKLKLQFKHQIMSYKQGER